MNLSIDAKERNLLICLAGLLILVVVWFAYCSPTKEKTDALDIENAKLKSTVDQYSAIKSRVADYEEGIINAENEMDEILSHYPSLIETEDQVMFWAELDNSNRSELALSDLEIGERDPLAVAGASTLDQANMFSEDGVDMIPNDQVENVSADYVLYGAPTGMNFVSTYDGMKKMFNYINNQDERNMIRDFEVYFDDSTGALSGAINVELLYIEGIDKEYSPRFIPSVPRGQSDVFHTGASSLNNLGEAESETIEGENDTETAQ